MEEERVVRGWIEGDESAKEMLSRVLTQTPPFSLPPPLHSIPLRPRNILEILGPSSAKTQLLIQAAITCILPNDYNGVHYGGLERAVMFVDLDCRFDVLHLSRSLMCRIREPKGSRNNVRLEENEVDGVNLLNPALDVGDKELHALCLRRFLYVRCYDSRQFLATLKTIRNQLQNQKNINGVGVHLLLIDRRRIFSRWEA